MNFRDDHRPSLWTERGHRDYGYDLTETELLFEDLELPPSRSLLRAAAVRASLDGARGADRLSRPPITAPGGNPCHAAGPSPRSDG